MAGKHSWFICQRSGFKTPYKKMRIETSKEGKGLRVAPEEFDGVHPQSLPIRVKPDSKPLRNAVPDTDDDGGVTTQLHELIEMTHGDRS